MEYFDKLWVKYTLVNQSDRSWLPNLAHQLKFSFISISTTYSVTLIQNFNVYLSQQPKDLGLLLPLFKSICLLEVH